MNGRRDALTRHPGTPLFVIMAPALPSKNYCPVWCDGETDTRETELLPGLSPFGDRGGDEGTQLTSLVGG